MLLLVLFAGVNSASASTGDTVANFMNSYVWTLDEKEGKILFSLIVILVIVGTATVSAYMTRYMENRRVKKTGQKENDTTVENNSNTPPVNVDHLPT